MPATRYVRLSLQPCSAADILLLQFFVVLVTELFSVTLGQGVAALSPSIYIAALQNPL